MIKTLKAIVKFIACKILYRVEFKGKENIDMSVSNVITPNHVSSFDAVFIWSDIQNLNIMAKEELFEFKPFGAVLKAVGVFPIARGKKDFGHVFHAVKLLQEDEKRNLLIFPEGTRNARLKGVRPKNGATYIAATSGVKIVPVHITEKIRLFGKVVIEYKEPITLNITKENIKDKELLAKETKRVMDIIYSRGE